MANWYELNLVFKTVGDLDGLRNLLDSKDSDSPTRNITSVGTTRTWSPIIPGPVSWRSPLIDLEALIQWLEDFGFEGEGWFFEEDGMKFSPDPQDHFTFSRTKARWEVVGNSASNGETTLKYERGQIIFSGSNGIDISVHMLLHLISRIQEE